MGREGSLRGGCQNIHEPAHNPRAHGEPPTVAPFRAWRGSMTPTSPEDSGPARGRPSTFLTPATLRSCGEGGIRTHGTVPGTHDFQSCQLNRSCTSPGPLSLAATEPEPQPE